MKLEFKGQTVTAGPNQHGPLKQITVAPGGCGGLGCLRGRRRPAIDREMDR